METGRELMVVAPPQQPPPPPPPPTSLAPGFRFHPTDEELVRYYLRRKICGKPVQSQVVSEVDVYKSEPWELADYTSLHSRDSEWYFLSAIDKKYSSGNRLNRSTGHGYWKETGKGRAVHHKSETIGMKKTLIFHSGPDGKRTNWVMHEYKLLDQELQAAGVVQDAFVLCRIFQKIGLGPPKGEHYAPFFDEEWEDDADFFIPSGDTEDNVTTGNNTHAERNNILQVDPKTSTVACKRQRLDYSASNSEPELRTLSLLPTENGPISSNANGSEESSMTSTQGPRITNLTSSLFMSPQLESIAGKETRLLTTSPLFDASALEKYVPVECLEHITDLENKVCNISKERDSLKMEMMQAQSMIDFLQSHIDRLIKENDELRRGV